MELSFNQVWEKVVKPLERKIVYTLDKNKSNEIVEVSTEHLIRDSENDSKPQSIKKDFFEIVYNCIMENGEITRLEINKAMPKRFSSIVCAVLVKAPNIGYDLNPIRLYRKSY